MLKTDPRFRIAVESLREEMPSLYDRFQEKAEFVGRANDGSIIRASIHNGEPRVLPSKGSGDSVITDTSKAPTAMETLLRRHGETQETIAAFKSRFEGIEDDVPLSLPTGDTFVKRSSPPLVLDLRGEFIDNRLPALIAFEFWALCIGRTIYDAAFDPIREYICNGTRTAQISVEELGGRNYDAFHSIAMEPLQGAIRTKIQFFRWIVYRVTLFGFEYRGPEWIYFLDLKARESFLAPSREGARQGNWFTI
jgi:hypothetical protein